MRGSCLAHAAAIVAAAAVVAAGSTSAARSAIAAVAPTSAAAAVPRELLALLEPQVLPIAALLQLDAAEVRYVHGEPEGCCSLLEEPGTTPVVDDRPC